MNTLEPMNTLGQRIAHYRKSSALTQEELAEKCGEYEFITVESREGDRVVITL